MKSINSNTLALSIICHMITRFYIHFHVFDNKKIHTYQRKKREFRRNAFTTGLTARPREPNVKPNTFIPTVTLTDNLCKLGINSTPRNLSMKISRQFQKFYFAVPRPPVEREPRCVLAFFCNAFFHVSSTHLGMYRINTYFKKGLTFC